MNRKQHRSVVLAACLVFGAATPALPATEEPSVIDRASKATVRGAKATNAWIARAAKKTDAALDRAAKKTGLPDGGKSRKAPARPGPRP